MKTTAFIVGLVLGCATSAFAANSGSGMAAQDSGSSHHVGTELKSALHRLGDATRRVLHRADASLHRLAHRHGQPTTTSS